MCVSTNTHTHTLLSRTGTGESGKSTFIKQMRIIHGAGYSRQDRLKYKELVYRNIMKAIVTLIEAMGTLMVAYEKDGAEQKVAVLRDVDPGTVDTITKEEQLAISWLWADQGVQTCYQRRREFQLSDSAK